MVAWSGGRDRDVGADLQLDLAVGRSCLSVSPMWVNLSDADAGDAHLVALDQAGDVGELGLVGGLFSNTYS